MNILFNNGELLQLMTNLYTLTGIRASVFDLTGKGVYLMEDHAPFCQQINACPEGHARCMACDAHAVACCASQDSVHIYRCHAGICDGVIPIFSNGTPVAYLTFGQVLDSTPLPEQWKRTRATLDWYPGEPDSLYDAFCAFRQYESREITAYAQILKTLSAYIYMSGMIQVTEYSDLQRLELYLDRHYMEKISLSTVSQELDISRTKLCALAKRLSGGKTLSQLIAERRVNAAKLLLVKSDMPISSVAEAVGIADYNYFTKIFRSVTGTTPSSFRKQHWQNITR